jgi:hypothetical protein
MPNNFASASILSALSFWTARAAKAVLHDLASAKASVAVWLPG